VDEAVVSLPPEGMEQATWITSPTKKTTASILRVFPIMFSLPDKYATHISII
jgi:hypothetical protein